MTDDARARTQSLYLPLQKPPAATSLTVRKLLGKLQEGAIRIPDFQRPLRWTNRDVVQLFDSILKGYPIGSLLFWNRQAPVETELRIGNAQIHVAATDDAWFIVDGQQRVTALAASLLDLDQRGQITWDLHFDPRTNEILPGAVPLEKGRQVPLRDLGDLRRLGIWLRECELEPEGVRRVEDVQQRLLDYELPAYVVKTDDVDALRGVFARLNSTGVRMRSHEVFQALLGNSSAANTGSKQNIDLPSLQLQVDIEGFGLPPLGEILKTVLAMSGLDPTKRLEDFDANSLAQLVTSDDAVAALQATVAFLQASPQAEQPGAGIPAYALIPYPIVFVILTRWFHLFPESDANNRRLLTQWVWRGIATGVHQRSAVSAMRLQVRNIQETSETDSLRRLLDAVSKTPPTSDWTLDPFNATHAASRVEILALLELAPRDKNGPIRWRSLLTSGERVAREIFAVQPKLNPGLRSLARTAANRILLDSQHTNLRSDLQAWTWAADQELLESHLIDEASFRDLTTNEPTAFLQHRGNRLRTLVSKFLHERAGFDEPIIFPANVYYDAKERAS